MTDPYGHTEEQYKQAVEIVRQAQQASVSLIQRRMRLGYTASARIIDRMEDEGLVSPYQGPTPRKVLIKYERSDKQ